VSDNAKTWLWVALIALLVMSRWQGCPVAPAEKATAATYVYEKDDTAVPSEVKVALDKLNRERKIVATVFEQDEKDGTGDTPEQYKVPLAAAKQAGLPALVATAGAKVLKVVKDPKTVAAVMEGVP